MMAPKRNDPCPCGSGKKYKHCHMKEDLPRAQAALRNPPAPAVRHVPPPVHHAPAVVNAPAVVEEPEELDPEIERFNQLYAEFHAADYEEQKAILRTAIEEKALDGELAFDFFNTIYAQMVERGERAEFGRLGTLLQTHQPDVYAKENHWFWSWEVHDALALGDDEALQRATNQLIENGGKDLDQFYPVYNCLLYHDRRSVLLNALDKHSLQLVEGKYFPGVEDEVNRKCSDVIVLNYIEEHPADALLAEDNLDSLCAALAPYTVDLLRDQLATFIAWAGGLKHREWTLADFAFAPPPPKRDMWYEEDEPEPEPDPAVMHLRNLSSEFLYYARHTENIPLTKADLARANLANYILERDRGELTDDESSRGSGPLKRSKKGRGKQNAQHNHVLLPDHKTLDRYLLRFYGFLALDTHEGAALFELIPAWVRFLHAKGLVEKTAGDDALSSLQALSQSLLKILEGRSDPLLTMNMRKWQEDAGIA